MRDTKFSSCVVGFIEDSADPAASNAGDLSPNGQCSMTAEQVEEDDDGVGAGGRGVMTMKMRRRMKVSFQGFTVMGV
ncbi:hypothetical protein Droror1_Dr00006315 [Drosera rotundifolia]